jgi:hypothetical protein
MHWLNWRSLLQRIDIDLRQLEAAAEPSRSTHTVQHLGYYS